ncbi:MAG: hypothetical protein ACT4P4_05685 [Betaproteobacteria bacterium]
MRALAVTTATRSSFVPELPTLEESGLQGFDLATWREARIYGELVRRSGPRSSRAAILVCHDAGPPPCR